MMTAGGTVTCHTGTSIVLAPTSTPNVTSNNALPNAAPRASTSVARTSAAQPDVDAARDERGGAEHVEKEREDAERGGEEGEDDVRGVGEEGDGERAGDDGFLGFEETRTTDAVEAEAYLQTCSEQARSEVIGNRRPRTAWSRSEVWAVCTNLCVRNDVRVSNGMDFKSLI